MKNRKIYNLFISLLMILNILQGPLTVLAQDASTENSTSTTTVLNDNESANSETENQTANQPETASSSSQEATNTQAVTRKKREADNNAAPSRQPKTLTEADYREYTTRFLINTHPVRNNAEYGEGKFYIEPTYKFPDNAVLVAGDTVTYVVPPQLRLEEVAQSPIMAGGVEVAKLSLDGATNTATITITPAGEDYYKKLNENKVLTALFTSVWADNIERDVVTTMEIPGAGTYNLTRIVPDEDPTGNTKWGVQNTKNPSLVDWRIRVNRYAKDNVTGVSIKDMIPDNQVLEGKITGYYFTHWGKKQVTNAGPLEEEAIKSTSDSSFTIVPNGGDLSGKGLFLIYQTRIVGPIDKATKRVLNNVHMDGTNVMAPDFEGFAPITDVDGAGAGIRSDEVKFKVKKVLNGRALQADEFSFELLDPNDHVVQTAKNDVDGNVKFNLIKFSNSGTYHYKIREVASNLPAVTNDAEDTINVTVEVTDQGGAKQATVTYDRDTFTNTYQPVATQVAFSVTKLLHGRQLQADEFTFELVNEQGVKVAEVKNKADGTVEFPEQTFSAVGTYTYKIKEKVSNLGGVTNDPNGEITATVRVSDQNAQLVADVGYSHGGQFTNIYAPAVTAIQLQARKVLTGKTLIDDQFNFEVVEKDNPQTVVATGKNKADGSVTFSEITYTVAGNHTYLIREKDDQAAHTTYDNKTIEVTVNVTDDGQGHLVAQATYPADVTFNNVYTPGPANFSLQVTKELTGRSLVDGEFSFDLFEENGTTKLATATNQANGIVRFAAMTKDQPGTYKYKIKEVNNGTAGITYDTKVIDVTVTVADADNDGILDATVEYSHDAKFVNTYTSASADVEFRATKALVGKALVDDQFTFELVEKATGNVIQTAKNKADGTIAFSAVTFAQTGRFEYQIREKNEGATGQLYDAMVIDVAVTVVDNGQGQLVATPEYPADTEFNNVYMPNAASATFAVMKELTGRLIQADEFTFELRDSQNAVLQTVGNAANGAVTFAPVAFDTVGTYTYTIVEQAGQVSGVTYDNKVITATVQVKDVNGNLVATVSYDNEGKFTNTYSAEAVDLTLTANKKMTGKTLEADEFEFEVVDAATKQMVVATGTNQADGAIRFTPIHYTAIGEFDYVIREKVPTPGKLGVTYSVKEIPVHVVVTDNGSGKLVATPTYSADTTFVNMYQPLSKKLALSVGKRLTGLKALEANAFQFTLRQADGTEIETVSNQADGTVQFSDITYDRKGTYHYTIEEVQGNVAGVAYDKKKIKVTVEVKEENGQLVATPTYEGDTVFTNTYQAASATATLSVMKELIGRDLVQGEFAFELKDAKGETLQTKENAQNGKVIFDAISYTAPGIYQYQIVEKVGSVPGVDYSTKVINVKVEVKDVDAQLVATVTYDDKAEVPTITNTYRVTAAQATLMATKNLVGRQLKDGEFEFELKDMAGTVLQTKANNANTVTFDAMTYDATGEYHYTITEKDTHLSGVSYDKKVVNVTVNVTDNGRGNLVAAVTYNDEANFTNHYQATATELAFSVTKELIGRELRDGEFAFELRNDKGEVLQTKTNTLKDVYFDAIPFDAVGAYHYTIVEKDTAVPGVAKDPKVVDVTVTVTDNNGQLEAQAKYKDDVKTFTNIYTPADGTAIIRAAKRLKNGDISRYRFTFELRNDKGELVDTAQSNEMGDIVFAQDKVKFNQPGTYRFTITEVNDQQSHIIYDAQPVDVTVKVVDIGNGQLISSVSYDEKQVFENIYETPKVTTKIKAKKVLTGREQNAGEFQFELVDQNGQVVATGTNKANGEIELETPDLNAGQYRFTLREKNTGDASIKYDTRTYQVSVIVAKNVEGKLVVKTQTDNDLVFENEYMKQQLPHTGEVNNGMSVLMFGLLLILVAGYLFASFNKKA